MLKPFVVAVLCSILVVVESLHFGDINVKKEDHAKYFKEEGYNPHTVPVPVVNGSDGGLVKKPLKVKASVNIKNIFSVREQEQMVSMEMTLRLYWKDKRIAPNRKYCRANDSLHGAYVTLIPDLMAAKNDKFWIPDIFINEAKNVRSPTVHLKPSSLRVYEDHTIRLSTRVNFDVFCAMKFQDFPFDVQTCHVKYESFGYTREIEFEWNYGDNDFNCSQINLHHFEFRPSKFDTYMYLEEQYQGLFFEIKFSRELEYLFVQVYIPSILFAVLDYVSLFVPTASVMPRVMVGMTTLLTQITMFSSFRRTIPQVSYITQLDVWMLFHTTFISLCILWSIFLLTLNNCTNWRKNNRHLLVITDRIIKVLMFLLYLSFSLWYWITNLTTRNDAKDGDMCSEIYSKKSEL